MPVIDACKIKFKLIRIFSLKYNEITRKKIETTKNLNDNAANGLADWTINWPLIKAELQKITNESGKYFTILFFYLNDLMY